MSDCDFRIKGEHVCKDCGHVQMVHGLMTSDNGVYFGSAHNWCDACNTGLPQFSWKIVVPAGNTEITFFMKGLPKKMAFQIGNQIFTLNYEPEEPSEFFFMAKALTNAMKKIGAN